jgi:hypothetical protein
MKKWDLPEKIIVLDTKCVFFSGAHVEYIPLKYKYYIINLYDWHALLQLV